MNDQQSNPFFSNNNNTNNNSTTGNKSSSATNSNNNTAQHISDINSFFAPLSQESSFLRTTTSSTFGASHINNQQQQQQLNIDERSDFIDPIVGQNIINNTISKFLQFNNSLSKQQQSSNTFASVVPINNFPSNNTLADFNNPTTIATIANMNNNNNPQIPPSLFQSLQRSSNTFQNQQQQQQQPQFNTPSPSSSPFPLMNNTQQPYPQSSSPFNFTPISNNNQRPGNAQSSVNLLASILANQNFAVPQQQQQQQQPQQQQITSSPASNNQQIQNLIAKIQSLESEIQSLKQDNNRVKGELTDFASSFVEFKNNFLGRASSGLGVIITSGDTGKILSANSCVLKLLGYDDLEHFRGAVAKWSDVVVQEDRQRVFSTFLQSALSSNDNCFIVFRAKRFDGKIITLSSNHVVAYDDGGENPFFSMSFFKQLDIPPEDVTSEQSV